MPQYFIQILALICLIVSMFLQRDILHTKYVRFLEKSICPIIDASTRLPLYYANLSYIDIIGTLLYWTL